MATIAASGPRTRINPAKYALFAVFLLLMIPVYLTRDHMLFEPGSFLRQRYAPLAPLMWLHGGFGALALVLGIFQFSTRLRQRYVKVHRTLGYVYIVSSFISAPVAVYVSTILVLPTLFMASFIQAFGWIACTATALYCVRTGRIAQHREWMMRGYPFAAVFVVVRAIVAIPAVAAGGELALAASVWSVIAAAGILPSFLIAWQNLARSKPATRAASAD